MEKALEKRYTEKFFAEYDLVIDLYAQKNDTWLVSPKADVTSESVTLTYDREFIRGFAPEGVYITQAVVPKGACRNRGTASKRSWEYQKNLTYKEYDIGILSASNNTDMLMTNKMDPQWVNSQAELDEYLGKCLTDEAIELIGAKLIWGSAYVWLDSGLTGTTHRLASSYISDDDKKITVNMLSSSPYGDMGGSFLHILSTDPSKSGYEVKKHDFNSDENSPTFDEDPVEIDFGDTSRSDFRTLFADQYSFGDEHSADLYITHSGGGPQRYRSYEYLGTIELSEEYEPFTDKYTTVENDDGSHTVTGEGFIITYNDGILSVSCRTSTDSEYKVLEFDIGN